MSFLDLYQSDNAAAMGPQPGERGDLPATFGESFEAAWNYGRLFSQSLAGETARLDALGDYVDEAQRETGRDLTQGIDWSGMAFGGAATADMMLGQVNGEIDKANRDKPPDQIFQPIDQDGLEQRAVAKSQAAARALQAVTEREHSSLGTFLGGAASAATDPINVLGLAVAPEAELGVLSSALRWGAIGGVSQPAIEAVGAPYHEEVQPGYLQSGEPVANVGEAFLGGAALGGATKVLGNLWTRVKTGAWPTSIKDAGNVVESQANVADSNVFLGAEGEAAHWDAMNFAIDQVLHEEPVDVGDIISPQIEQQSRNLMIRLQSEQAAGLPAFDQRSVALLSEEAQLRERGASLATQLENLPEGDAVAADRLNRLRTVDAQIAQATDATARRRLTERRDQILVDTTPEELAAKAAPIEQRRQIEAEQESVSSRLGEIERERTARRAQALGATPAAIGQHEPVRQIPIEQLRQMSEASARLAAQQRAEAVAQAIPELPFEATGAEAQAQASGNALVAGVQQIARRGGYEMPPEEAAQVAGQLAKMTPEDAQEAVRNLQVSPRQAAAGGMTPAFPEPTRPPPADSEAVKAALSSPDYEQAMRSDIDRERMMTDKQIPVGVDENGEPVYRSLDAAMDEIDAYQKAADDLLSCVNPAKPWEAA